MTTTISIEEAKINLSEIVGKLAPGDEVVITRNDQPVARLTPVCCSKALRKLGTMKGTVLHMAPDFDTPLNDFKDYME